MRRVSRACVRVENEPIGEIGKGLLVYLGIEAGDNIDDMEWVLRKRLLPPTLLREVRLKATS